MNKRIEWIDILKGVTVILVVIHHSILSAYTFDLNKSIFNIDSFIMPLNGQLGALRMPSFFLASGLVMASIKRDKLSWFLNKRAPIMLWMIVVWTAISIIFELLGFHLYPWEQYPYFDNWYSFPYPFGNIWFMYALFILSAFAACIYKFDYKIQIILTAMLSFFINYYILMFEFDIKINFLLLRNLAYKGFPFFIFGFVFKDAIVNFFSVRRNCLILFSFASILFITFHFLQYEPSGYSFLFFKYIPGTAAFLSVIVVLSHVNMFKDIFKYIGKFSLQIFLLHIFFVAIFHEIYSNFLTFETFADRLFLIFSPMVFCVLFVIAMKNYMNPIFFSLPKSIERFTKSPTV